MGFSALRSLANTISIPVEHDPDPDSDLQLSYADYADYVAGLQRIASTTFVMDRSPEQAWPDFRGWRINYEAIAYALADRFDAVPAPWTGQATPEIRPCHPSGRPTAHPPLTRKTRRPSPPAPPDAARDARPAWGRP